MKEKQLGGKRAIIKDLMAKGFTARKAAKAVNAVFSAWKEALGYWEPVETPCGVLQVKVTHGRTRQKLQKFRNIATEKATFHLVRYPGRRRVVKLKPHPKLDLTPPLPPPKAETAEESEERQLASTLLGHPADQVTMAALRRAVETNPRTGAKLSPKPDSLRRRLREMKARGWKFSFAAELAQQVSEYYWL